MKPRRLSSEGKPALELVEETIHLLRLAPARIFVSYYAGTLPFVLAFLYFWADMSQSALAEQRLPAAALVLSVLYLWMKTWQAIYARQLLARLANEPAPTFSVRQWWKICRGQAALQPLGLFLLPLALLLFFPLAWVYAFFQNATALGASSTNVRELFRRAWLQASLWPKQNHIALVVWKAFGLVVVVNLLIAVFVVPMLLRTLFGFENAFTRLLQDPDTMIATLLSSTLLTILFSVTYLCLDPMLKAFYVWRCYYGESVQTGYDLSVELSTLAKDNLARESPRRNVGALFVLVWLLACPFSAALAAGAPAPTESAREVAPEQLDQTIKEVISRREYAWRLPRAKAAVAPEKNTLAKFLDSVAAVAKEALQTLKTGVEKVLDWVGRKRTSDVSHSAGGGSWTSLLQDLLLILCALLVGIILFLIFRLWRNRSRAVGVTLAQPVTEMPDLTEEHVAADQLPEDQWRELGATLLSQGEFRLALRAYYLASLAHLAQKQLVTLAKFKSNRDYERELERRSHALPTLWEIFRDNVSTFDRIWYGWHAPDRALVEQFAHNVERIRNGS